MRILVTFLLYSDIESNSWPRNDKDIFKILVLGCEIHPDTEKELRDWGSIDVPLMKVYEAVKSEDIFKLDINSILILVLTKAGIVHRLWCTKGDMNVSRKFV